MISQPDGSLLKRVSAASPRSSVAIRLLVALAIGALLYFAHAVFIPIALAVLFSLLLTAPWKHCIAAACREAPRRSSFS